MALGPSKLLVVDVVVAIAEAVALPVIITMIIVTGNELILSARWSFHTGSGCFRGVYDE